MKYRIIKGIISGSLMGGIGGVVVYYMPEPLPVALLYGVVFFIVGFLLVLISRSSPSVKEEGK